MWESTPTEHARFSYRSQSIVAEAEKPPYIGQSARPCRKDRRGIASLITCCEGTRHSRDSGLKESEPSLLWQGREFLSPSHLHRIKQDNFNLYSSSDGRRRGERRRRPKAEHSAATSGFPCLSSP